MKSAKELSLDSKIIGELESLQKTHGLEGRALTGLRLLLEDEEIQATQEYANNVSIVRLGFNDHGPVHMRSVVLNSIIMMDIVKKAKVKTSLEAENSGCFDDSLTAVVFASMLHDLGMSVGRQDHELHSAYLASPIMDRLLAKVYEGNMQKKIIVRSLALEGIAGHMGTRTIHSLEAGIIQAADGCDMKKGRARIPMALTNTARVGKIHQYSANSIEKVSIRAGGEKPIRIDVLMSSEVGLFQVEEVLMTKIAAGTAKPLIELYTQVQDKQPSRYL